MVIHLASSVSEWEALASATFVPVRVESPVERFVGTMDHRGTQETGITRIRSGAGRVSRTVDLLESSPDDIALFSLQVRGTSRVEQGGRTAQLRPGDGALYLTRGTYDLVFPQAGELAVLQLPSESLGLRAGSLATLAALALHGRHDPAMRTFTRVVRSLFTDRPVIDHPDQALRVAAEILGAVLGLHRHGDAPSRSHTALFAAFDRAIHEHVDDPRLDVTTLALMENVSVRTVHHVFAERGMTPAAYIREQRMHRARRLLASTNLQLVDIAVRCGSTDPSVFSRAFRRETGMTPSEYRRGHIS